ncbi:F-box and leucine-rich repeat protein 18 [Desmophyllum pertusum]|uniref:F-box and leucine-rich repeat protein 18 n=1 Tax=Desmophyllum pertusum TaxID=174260 RepID=A0A9X0D842_9CNID|nr:F-box and leucine-rich repeat protein 18 [Desmophyllum pertusum]
MTYPLLWSCSKIQDGVTSQEMLFTIFQNLDPLELISLSRVNRRWHNVALHPRLHRSVDFQRKPHLSSTAICKYINKFKHSLQELNLQECYWIEGRALSSALQKCRTLTSLNVLGCSVTKKNLCSVLKQNGNIRSLAWSIQASDLRLITSPSHPTPLFREFLVSFCSELAIVFTGLD